MKNNIFLFYKKLIVPGGAERLLIEEYNTFKSDGHNVKIVVFDYSGSALFGNDISSDIIKLNSKFWIVSLFKFWLVLVRSSSPIVLSSSGIIEVMIACLMSMRKYHLHLHHPITMNLDSSKYSFFLKKKYKYILERSYEPEKIDLQRKNNTFFQLWYISLRQLLISMSIKLSDNVFVLSKYAKDEVKYIYGVEAKVVQGAIRTINPECHIEPFVGGFNGTKILSVSRLEPEKRIDNMIYAFYNFLNTNPNSTLFIGGSGSQESYLKNLVKEMKIEDKVLFLGFIPNKKLINHYYSVDIFLSLDWADYNITVYEALSTGTRVVASNEGEFNQSLIGNNYIFHVDPLDIGSIANGLVQIKKRGRIMKDYEFLRELELYTWSNYCKSIIKFCNQ